jgi:hypothetical protein
MRSTLFEKLFEFDCISPAQMLANGIRESPQPRYNHPCKEKTREGLLLPAFSFAAL